jgi:HSP20 family protein
VKKEDVKVDLVNDRLTISGSTKEDAEYTDSDHHITHRERAFGTFTRALQVPAGIKAEEIKASMENGILKVS